jgi:zinc finger CCCH domain-containing protein 15
MAKGKKKAAPSKKSVQKVKKKIVEDRTFGLKNKNKSKKVQKFVRQVEQAAATTGINSKQARLEERRRKQNEKAKKEAEARSAMVASLFTPVITNKPVKQLAKAGVNPKSQLCAYFKAGKCNKGKRCKFSHDLSIERKVEKINLYEDPRKKGMCVCVCVCTLVTRTILTRSTSHCLHALVSSFTQLPLLFLSRYH